MHHLTAVSDSDYTIEEIDIRTVPEPVMRELYDLALDLHRESAPDDPEPKFETMSARNRNLPSIADVSAFTARDAPGRLVGTANCGVIRAGDNEHLAQSSLSVRPADRGHGLGRLLLTEVVAAAGSKGATTLMGFSSGRVPAGGEFARRVGAELAQEQHENRLDLRKVDRALVEKWVAEGPTRAPGYRLEFVDGAVPDDMLESVCAVFDIMNTAPQDDLAMTDMHMRPQLFRAYEGQVLNVGGRRWGLYARHQADGRLVGFTDVNWHPDRPQIVNQGGTAVEPSHRGHALGKWLKGDMVRRILSDLPNATHISTTNADSNDAMLGINHDLGFGPYAATLVWQVPLEKARQYLGGSLRPQ
jgi:mycothiol synthase